MDIIYYTTYVNDFFDLLPSLQKENKIMYNIKKECYHIMSMSYDFW